MQLAKGDHAALTARLQALSPLAVLDRGYALVLNEQGSVVRSATQVSRGELVVTRLADGLFTSRVENAGAHPKDSKNEGNE